MRISNLLGDILSSMVLILLCSDIAPTFMILRIRIKQPLNLNSFAKALIARARNYWFQ
jgi:hypothetical protein